MKFEIWALETTKETYITEGERIYLKRLKHYIPVELKHLKGLRSKSGLSENQVRDGEASIILSALENESAMLVLLDGNGVEYSSLQFASQLESWLGRGPKKIIFIIGGAYGFSKNMLDRADVILSLSKMTFTHQMIRLFLLEQIYRAMTILRNEKYHH